MWQVIAPPDSGLSKPMEGVMTTVAKKKRVFTGLPRKTYWHLYSLQNLQAEKLAKIVNKVLSRDYVLIK
jgi:predicted nucleotidyltransferase component of viral defense system